jgi:ABC-type transport system involved in cytochrome c biogenesis permease subunit
VSAKKKTRKDPRVLFWGIFAAGLLAAAAPLAVPGPQGAYSLSEFARLPVLEGGRVKPVDSFARNSLLVIRGTQSLPLDGKSVPAVKWLMDALWKPEAADTQPVFVIDDPDVRGLLGLTEKTRRFAYWQLEPHRDEIHKQAGRASGVKSAARSRFQSAIMNLDQRLDLYERIKNTLMISGDGDPAQDMAIFAQVIPRALRVVHGGGKAVTAKDRAAVKVLSQLLERYRFLAQAAAFRPLPPRPGQKADAWSSIGEAMLNPSKADGPHPGLADWAMMGRAYRQGDPAAFRQALATFAERLQEENPSVAAHARAEVLFNRAQPFVSGMALYVAALLAVFAWWGTRRPETEAAARGLFAAAVLVHTVGLVARIVLQGRPPVTNLYSSAVFVGWVSAVLGLAAERAHRKGFAIAGGALLGFCTLVIAQHLSASGDTMEMMRAVLDSNFWLATHVVTVTIGYGSTFLAAALGVAWVARKHLVNDPDPEMTKALVGLTYGVICFSLLFSFVGTTLGGIWADQSWGRFWGWDPKENGALLIVLWNASILHARWGGYIRERGLMVMAVGGGIVTSLSWFGVNMLGIGLHSYGFMAQAFYWLAAFIFSQLVLIALGLLPKRFWEIEEDEEEA